MRAYDFYSKFGVNGNLDSGGSVSAELADMNYLGIKNVRSSVYNASAGDVDRWFSKLALLSAQGIRQHIDVQAQTGGMSFNRMSDWINALRRYVVSPYGADMVTGVSGPNETNIGQYFAYEGVRGVPAANAAQAHLYEAIKADPGLRSIPVDMWPLGLFYLSSATAAVGNRTAHCDRANLHDYYAADNTHNATVHGNMQIALHSYLKYTRLFCNRTNFVTTETGWYTPWRSGDNSLGTNEYEQARLILNDLFDHASLPYCKGVYIYTLRWGSVPPDSSTPGWGVMNNDGSPKAAGRALHNLMAILTDPGTNAKTFTPGRLNYSLSGMPAASGNFLIQRSNGAFQLILWNETPIWNVSNGSRISIPSSMVTVSLPSGSSGAVYDPTTGSTPITKFSNINELEVNLNDSPLIIKVQ